MEPLNNLLAMLNLQFRYRFEAAHRFLVSPSLPCRTPHGHSWHATLVIGFVGKSLNEHGMAISFEEVKSEWKQLVTKTLDHSFFHHWQDPLVEHLKVIHPESRLLPFPNDPTTELLGLLLFSKMETVFQKFPKSLGLTVETIKVEETPSNCVSIHRPFFLDARTSQWRNFDGWWNSTDIQDRSIKYDSSVAAPYRPLESEPSIPRQKHEGSKTGLPPESGESPVAQ